MQAAEAADDGEVLVGTIDKTEPWTIKAFSRNTRNRIVAAARQEGVTTGEWMERCANERLDGEQDVSGTSYAPTINLGDLASYLQAATALAKEAGVPVPARLARSAFTTLGQITRQARGLAPRRPALRHDTPA